MSDTRKYGERYDRYVESFKPHVLLNECSHIRPLSYEDFAAWVEFEDVRRWPLKAGDGVVYLDGFRFVTGGLYTQYLSTDILTVTREYVEYTRSGVKVGVDPKKTTQPTAMRLLPGDELPENPIAAMAMIVREAKKHKWLENYKKWR